MAEAGAPSDGLTAHSFKRGALEVAAKAVLTNDLPRDLLPLLAKHKTATPVLPSTTLRYIADPALKADLLQTSRITSTIPW